MCTIEFMILTKVRETEMSMVLEKMINEHWHELLKEKLYKNLALDAKIAEEIAQRLLNLTNPTIRKIQTVANCSESMAKEISKYLLNNHNVNYRT